MSQGRIGASDAPSRWTARSVVATVLALQEWLAMDHEARWQGYRRQVENLCRGLAEIPEATLTPMCFTMDERLIPDPVNCLVVDFAPTAARSAEQVSEPWSGQSEYPLHRRGARSSSSSKRSGTVTRA